MTISLWASDPTYTQPTRSWELSVFALGAMAAAGFAGAWAAAAAFWAGALVATRNTER